MRYRTLIVSLVLVGFAAGPVAAQRFIPKDALIAIVEIHKASVLKFIDAAPDSMLGYRPTKGVRTFAQQIEHAVWADAFIAHSAITGSQQVPTLGDSTVYLRNKTALKAYAVAAMDHTIEMVRAVSDAAMVEEITQFG